MKSLNSISIVSGGEYQGQGTNGQALGRIRYNTNLTYWEFSNNNGTNWLPFSAVSSVNGETGNVVLNSKNNICYVVDATGNDTSAQIGNILKPFKTIGAAINVARLNSGSTIEVLAGTYNIGDLDTPASDGLIGNLTGYGLMFLGASYDYYFHPNTTINYAGTYGLYISDTTTQGNIYGYADFSVSNNTFSGSISDSLQGSVNNYPINISINTSSKYLNFNTFVSTSDGNGIRIGEALNAIYGVNLNIETYLKCDGNGTPLLIDRGSISNIISNSKNGYIRAFGISNITVIIDGSYKTNIKDIKLISNGTFTGCSQNVGIQLNFRTDFMSSISQYAQNDIEFNNTIIQFIIDDIGYKLIEFVLINNSGSLTINNKLRFINCLLQNRKDISNVISGNSFYTDTNMNIIFIDTIANADIAGTGIVTNLLTSGVGFIYSPNI